MKVNRLGEHFSTLEKSQMQEIDRLQEKIKLYEFDRSKDNQKIRELQETLSRKTKSINSVIQELELMRKESNYSRLLTMINVLKIISREGYDE